MPAYNDTPQATQQVDEAQPLIRTNFTTLQSAIGINHVVPFTAANYGKHKYVTFPEQATSPATLANEAALYTKQGTGAVTQLFYRPENQGVAGDEIELTYALKNQNGYTYLPSGLLLRWGTGTVTGVSSYTVNTAPYFTHIYNVQISVHYLASTNRSATLRNYTIVPATSFTLILDGAQRTTDISATVEFDYLIIGD